MRKSVLTLAGTTVTAAALALSLAACGGVGEAREAGNSSVPTINSGTLTVCISKNAYEPLYWNDGGTLTGFDVDSISEIGKELGLKTSFSEMAFDGLLPALLSGRCDILRSGLYVNEERSAKADTIPYLTTGPALIVPQGNPLGLKNPEDLSGVRIAAQAASANEKILRGISDGLVAEGKPGIELSVYPELPETIGALKNGRVDATIETDVAAMQAVKTLGDNYEVTNSIFDANTKFGMFLPKDSELTSTIYDVALKLTENGRFAEVAEKYGLQPSHIVAPGSE